MNTVRNHVAINHHKRGTRKFIIFILLCRSELYWSGEVLFIIVSLTLLSLRSKSVVVFSLCYPILTWIAVGFSFTSVTEIVKAFSSFIGGLPLSVLLITSENLRR